MKNLIEYIEESLLDDIDTLSKNTDKEIKQKIKQFLKDNFKGVSKCKMSRKPNSDGKYVVDCTGDVVIKNTSITSLTNGLFVWGEVDGHFECYNCRSLINLEGAPKEVGGHFACSRCTSLINLEGSPEKVRVGFWCNDCTSLKSLKGAPKEVRGFFECSYCPSLTSLEGAPEKVGGHFDCCYCDSLKSLKGAPKEVGGDFDCSFCPSLESYDISSNIKGRFIK